MIKKLIPGRIFQVTSRYKTINTVSMLKEHKVLMSPETLLPNDSVVILCSNKITTINKILYDQCCVLTQRGIGWITTHDLKCL